MILEVPVDPGAEEARELLLRELVKPAYQAAQPSWFDQLAAGFWEWLGSLFGSGIGGSPTLVLVVIVVVILALLVVAYFVFGPPRLNRRSSAVGALFGDDDSRDAATIRRSAEAAAAASDWPLAIEEMFRAIARGMSERAILATSPGTTATGFATRATEYFPGQGTELTASARSFDEVRYLNRPGSAAGYAVVAELERVARSTTPRFEAPVAAG